MSLKLMQAHKSQNLAMSAALQHVPMEPTLADFAREQARQSHVGTPTSPGSSSSLKTRLRHNCDMVAS